MALRMGPRLRGDDIGKCGDDIEEGDDRTRTRNGMEVAETPFNQTETTIIRAKYLITQTGPSCAAKRLKPLDFKRFQIISLL
jgi:hypothetical protein